MDKKQYKLIKEFYEKAPTLPYQDLARAIYDLQVEGGFRAGDPIVRFGTSCLLYATGILTVMDKEKLEHFIHAGPGENENKQQSCCYLTKEVGGCVCKRKEVCEYHGERHFGTHD